MTIVAFANRVNKPASRATSPRYPGYLFHNEGAAKYV